MKGVIAAVPTPVDTSGVPQELPFVAHCKWALENGCDGLNVLGSTGEASSFDSAARKRVMRWAAQNLPMECLMVGTGTPSLEETITLTCFADDLGYRIALILPPYYYKPVSENGLLDWYAEIHSRLETRRISIFFYNFPRMTGIDLPVSLIASLHGRWPERFAGIKDSSGNLEYCRQLTSTIPTLSVFPSSEVALAEAGSSGFSGCISATANQTGMLSQKLWAGTGLPDSGLAGRISKLRTQITSGDLVPSVKFLVGRQTGDAGWENLVPPFKKLTSDRKSELIGIASQLNRD